MSGAASWASFSELENHLRRQDPSATVRFFHYENEEGRPVAAKIRIDQPSKGKTYRIASLNADGRVVMAKPEGKSPLFNLPAVLNHDFDSWLLVVEGEKASEYADVLDLVATTSGGSGTVAGADWSPVKGRRVAILPDNDESGAKYGVEAARAALEAGAADVRIVEPAALGLTDRGDDLAEFVERGGNRASRDQLREELLARVEQARPMRHSSPVAWPGVGWGEMLKAPPVEWLVQGLVPCAGSTMLFGNTGAGKSFLIVDLLARIAHGMESWMGQPIRKHGPVLYFVCEGYSGLGGRTRAWQLHHHEERQAHHVEFADANAKGYSLLSQQGRIDFEAYVAELAARHGEPALVVVDTLARAVEGDEKDADAMREPLNCLDRIARRHRCGCIAVHHPRKAAPGQSDRWLTLDDGRGSGALTCGADQGLIAQHSKGNRCLEVAKAKDGKNGGVYGYELDVVITGVEQHGDIEDSCVIRPTGVRNAPRIDKEADKALKVAQKRSSILEAARAAGEPISKRELVSRAGIGKDFDYVVGDLVREGALLELPYSSGRGSRYTLASHTPTDSVALGYGQKGGAADPVPLLRRGYPPPPRSEGCGQPYPSHTPATPRHTPAEEAS